MTTAEMLVAAGDIKLPSNLPTSSLTSSMTSTSSPACLAILSIHQYRDAAVTALRAQAEVLSNNQVTRSPEASAEDFNSASDNLDTSFQQLRTWLDQLGTAARTLQQCSTDSGLPEEIDRLEREAVMDKMGELGNLNCSLQVMTMIIMMMFVMMILQFWEPVRSLGHTRDLQEIELLAVNAKKLIYSSTRSASRC